MNRLILTTNYSNMSGSARTYDTVFPAVDSQTVKTLGGEATSGSPDVTGIINQNMDNFAQVFNSAEGAGQDVLTYGTMLSRNMTVANMAHDMIAQNNKMSQGSKDTYTRQGEINEWAAQNKMDTLFFLQITFLLLSFAILFLFLRRYGMISNYTTMIILLIMLIIAGGTLWNRAIYTSQTRDKRYWNRRFIGLPTGISVSQKCANDKD